MGKLNNTTTLDTVQNQPRLLTPESFAVILNLHPESIRRCIRAGRIKAKKFGRSWRITQAEADRVITEGLEAA
jgi:excisionase family DNA binding protein